MAILQCTNSIVGTVGVVPNFVFINTNDTPATVVGAGYLNGVVHEGLLSVSGTDLALVNTTSGVLWLQVTITGTAPNLTYSLSTPTNSGGAVFLGNVTAGSTSVQGGFISYAGTATGSTLTLKASASALAANTTTITNASLGQATTFTIPDPGISATKFLLTNSAGTQTIATGSLALTAGNLTLTAGSLTAGSSGHAGTLTSFPGTASNGKLVIAAVNNAGNHTTTISSVAGLGQDEVMTIPDVGAATGQFVVKTAAFVDGNLVKASGTAGVLVDQGFAMKSVAQAAVAGGAAAQTVTDAFCTTGSMVVACWNDTSNPVDIQKVAAGNGSFVVTSSGDPGASHLNYIITK